MIIKIFNYIIILIFFIKIKRRYFCIIGYFVSIMESNSLVNFSSDFMLFFLNYFWFFVQLVHRKNLIRLLTYLWLNFVNKILIVLFYNIICILLLFLCLV